MSLNQKVNSNGQNCDAQSLINLNGSQSIRRNTSFNAMNTSTEANVLVIYTGGTIGMIRNSNNGEFFLLNYPFIHQFLVMRL